MIEFGKILLTSPGQSARTITAQLRLTGDEGDDNDAEPADGCEVVQPLGVIARPAITPHTEAAYVRIGNEIVVLALLDKSAATVTDLQEGELHLYAPGNVDTKIQLLPNGDIRFRGGSTPVAKEGSQINEHYHKMTTLAFAGPFPVAGTTDMVPSSAIESPGPVASNVKISTSTGSQNVKVP